MIYEIGRWKYVMNIYVENWKFWMDYGLMEILCISWNNEKCVRIVFEWS